ncbi:uncharacterized protein J8A68_000211 [[Candida] subhashii]|uniref:Major facilitator superfamily (MFS) profile domain-containing protein n=1 Tax=[Candida] subhashii TaxID=561895 RepID=A0A8J5UMT0_9ASCO|nr:uncharacterized protein J8A68_000211 [[Candida] subhashii]KAG7666258.1 hypothetical protein J8A68_000211 [[Candida] subhashii]
MPAESVSVRTVESVTVAKEHNKHLIQAPEFTWPVIRKYFGTRISSLWVGKEELAQHSWNEILNPFQPLDVSWGLTVVLMLRTVGALIFGAIGDMKGRKWPYIANLSLLVAIQCGTGFVTNFKMFLGTRAAFGIAMGGLYGICAAEALSDAPTAARGVLSGLFQEGYAFGFLLATVFQRAISDTTPHGWRSLFWFSAGPPVILIIWRFFTPETDTYQHIAAKRASAASGNHSKFANFKTEASYALKNYWLIIIYLVFMMAGFNFSSHGSQDLYPTLLQEQYHYGKDKKTVVLVCSKLGALAGGVIVGHFSSIIGRRTAILIANIFSLAFIYPWAFQPTWVTAFFMQFGIQGAWSVVPIHLSELSPPQFRAFVMGVSYQLGNLVSSASATIEATIGEKFLLPDGTHDYAKTMAIFVAAVVVYLFVVVLLGPEIRNAELGIEREEVYAVYDAEEGQFDKLSFDHTEDASKQKAGADRV